MQTPLFPLKPPKEVRSFFGSPINRIVYVDSSCIVLYIDSNIIVYGDSNSILLYVDSNRIFLTVPNGVGYMSISG